MDLNNKHMKAFLRTLKIFFIVCTVAVSCKGVCGCHEYEEVGVDKAAVFGSEYLLVNGPTNDKGEIQQVRMYIVKWRYDGHNYIYFHNNHRGSVQGEGVVHDPKCPCSQPKSANETISDYESVFGTW